MLTSEDFPFKLPPLKHQLECWNESRDREYYALFHEQGTGKSKITVDTMAWLYMTGKIDTVLVLSLKGVYSNWKYTEIPTHMPDVVDYQCEIYRSGLRQAEKTAIRKVATADTPRLRILCVNIESLGSDNRKRMTTEGAKVAAGFLKARTKGAMLIVDESTAIKSYRAIRAKTVQLLAQRCDYRRILTGTPVPRSPLDVWGQALVLSPDALGHRTFTEFRSEYAIVETVTRGSRSFPTISGYQRLDKLQARIQTFGSIKERSECVDLPPKIYRKTAVALTSKQESLYEQMRDEALATLGDGQIVEATNALGVISRLDQISCGQLKREDGNFEILDSNRPAALLEDLEQSTGRGIVWCAYRGLLDHLYERIQAEFGHDSVGRFYGGVHDDERESVVKRFQDPASSIRWIVANQASMGHGRTLTLGTNNWYYANSYNLEHRLQSEDRTMRIGQTSKVLYNDLYTPGTVNERIMANLREKRSLASQVLGTRITDWI
jgi:hypothetical protein